jgi:phosphoribosylaminoimidazole-succinocarboxamide synthase
MYFALQSDIARAMELPEPEISKVEYELKDELIRNTIMDTQEDVEEIKETIKKIDQRLYEMTR